MFDPTTAGGPSAYYVADRMRQQTPSRTLTLLTRTPQLVRPPRRDFSAEIRDDTKGLPIIKVLLSELGLVGVVCASRTRLVINLL